MAPLSSPYFLAQVASVLTGTPTPYTFVEVWRFNGAVAQKVGGRYGNASQPGYAVDGNTYTVGQLVYVRSADGDAGLDWELTALSSGTPFVNGAITMSGADLTAFVLTVAIGTFTTPAGGAFRHTFRFNTHVTVQAGNPSPSFWAIQSTLVATGVGTFIDNVGAWALPANTIPSGDMDMNSPTVVIRDIPGSTACALSVTLVSYSNLPGPSAVVNVQCVDYWQQIL